MALQLLGAPAVFLKRERTIRKNDNTFDGDNGIVGGDGDACRAMELLGATATRAAGWNCWWPRRHVPCNGIVGSNDDTCRAIELSGATATRAAQWNCWGPRRHMAHTLNSRQEQDSQFKDARWSDMSRSAERTNASSLEQSKR